VGHNKLGARNPSFGRNLSKLSITTAKEDEGGRMGANGTPSSPRHKPNTKRSQTHVALMPKNASGTALRKNHSSGHLHRNTSGKHLSRSHRPEYHRTRSNDGERKSKRLKSPPPPSVNGKHASVHFDIGSDEDEAEDMEGVDDGWTEESASQSPSTTRDNTRSNTRNNSVILDAAENPYKKDGDEEKTPLTALPDRSRTPLKTEETAQADDDEDEEETPTAPTKHERKSSYHDTHRHQNPPDAEAIAKRLLQRNEPRPSNPQLSPLTAVANSHSSTPSPQQQVSPLPPSSTSATLVSRFIDPSISAPGSKDATPQSPAPITRPTTATSTASTEAPPPKSKKERAKGVDEAIRRNKSTPSFILPVSPPGSGGASGASTPGGPLRQSRTQQKLWLQRGLSNIEANSASNLPGLLMVGGRRGGGSVSHPGGVGMVGLSDRIEKELAAVRRYRSPIEESIGRLRKVKGGSLGVLKVVGEKEVRRSGETVRASPKKAGKRDGAKTPATRSRAASPAKSVDGRRGKKDRGWAEMSLEELEEATYDVRRRMWELHSGGEDE